MSECPTCGEEFKGRKGVSIHHVQAHGESIAGFEHECGICGETFTHKSSEAQYCSRECFAEAHSERMAGEKHPLWDRVERECKYCGQVDLVPKCLSDAPYCSQSCAGLDRDMSGENNPMYGFSGPKAPRWKGGEVPYGEGWNETKKEAVRERDGRECQHCGRPEQEHLELFGCKHHVHHIHPARELYDTDYDQNDMENLVTLCMGKCHTKWEQMAPLRPA